LILGEAHIQKNSNILRKNAHAYPEKSLLEVNLMTADRQIFQNVNKC